MRSFVPVLFILCLQACAGVALAEPSTATTQVEKLLSSGRYQLIDQMEKEIRASKQVDDEDRPALSVLYRALAGVNLGSDAAWRARRQLLEKWRDADGDSFIPKLVLANHYYYYAWWLRSTQVGPKLSRAQVDGFRANLRESFWLASSITFSADDDPAWWELMLWLGVAQGWPKLLFNQTYSHAVALRPDYFLYHLAKAQYVSARWYGSREEFVAYVDAVTEKYGKDFGDRLYGRLQWNLRLPNMFDSGQASWPKTRQSYEAIVKAWPTRRNNKEFAELACMAKDWKFAANSIAAMDPPVTVDEKNGLYLRQCKREADGYNAVAIKRPAEAPAITNAATKKSSPVPAHWAQPEANEQDVPAEKEHVSDAAEIAAVAGDKVPYEKQRNAVLDVAKRNPAIISMIDARKIRLLEKDLAQVILLVATRDPEKAVSELHRVPHEQYETRQRIRDYYRSKLRLGYASWVWDHPSLWGDGEAKLFAEVRPKETLNRLARTSNPDWYLRTVEDVLVKRVPVPLFEYLFRLPPEQREKEFKSAMDKLERANPDNVVEIAAKYDDDLGQRTKGVLLDLVRLDHDPIALVDKYHIDLPEQSLADLIEQFAYRHPKAAGRYLSRMDEKTKQRVISRIAYFYRDKFKEDYKEWLEENPEWMSRSDKSRLQAKKAESSAGTQDVAAALESVVLPESRLQQDAVAAFTRIVKQDPKGARDWADKTTRKVPDTAIAIIADLLDQQRRPDTYEWLSGFPESRRLRQVRIDSFDLLAHSDPARASTLVGTMPADRRMPAIHAVLQEWLDKDTGAAMSWIRTVAPGPERDEAMLDAGDYLVQADMDYQSALKLYGMIGNPNSRRLAVMNIMPLIYLKDTDTFSALAKRYGFDQDQLSEFKQTASHIKLVNGHL